MCDDSHHSYLNAQAMLRFLSALAVIAALVALYFFAALKWSYSSGERAGFVQKLSEKGWVCKTWEGEMAMVSMPGTSVEKFYFTIRDDEVAKQVTKHVGKRVSLHYEEKVGLPTTCFGETRYFVTKVEAELDGAPPPAAAPPLAPAAATPPTLSAPAPVASSAMPAVVRP
jgi:hypothetical protein